MRPRQHTPQENDAMRWTAALIVPALVLFAPAPGRADGKAEKDVRQSVVRVTATQRFPHLLKPWTKQDPRDVAGSGVVLDGRRILTNAHLVLYATQIYVQPHQSSDKLPARVVRAAPGIDLAVLALDDGPEADAFFQSRPAVPRTADLPEPKEAVSVYGYPIGGTSLAVTRGTVARIGFGGYGAGEFGLQIQIDAALNPGNSGGPALVKDRMIGLVVGSSPEGQNIGYLIPDEEITGFLTAPGTGPIPPKPRLIDEVQPLQNAALRARLKLDRSVRGVLVRAPASADPSYPLKKGDVITRVGSYDLDNDGMVRVRENLHLAYPYVVAKLGRQGRVPVTVLRQGQPAALDLPVAPRYRPLVRPLNGGYPSYFVYGPLVFSTPTPTLVNLLDGQFGEGSPFVSRRNDEVAFDGEELVVVTMMLPHKLAGGYGNPLCQVVSQVNGTRIRNLRHLVQTLRAAAGRFVEIEFFEKYVETLVFDREEVLAATDDILSDNGIRQQCSPDLRAVWQPAK
jgi:S1-C subfamily serine protease